MYHFTITEIQDNLKDAMDLVIREAELSDLIDKNVFIKPNFTYPFFKPGVTTTREIIVAIIELLIDHGASRICIGEGEGGYNSFSMDDTFRNYRLEELERRYGIEVVNVSKWPPRTLSIETRQGHFAVNVPAPIFEEFDSFFTLPVPKVHSMTIISNAIKNQWGLIQDTMRLSFHCGFDEIITVINSLLPNPVAITDGRYGLTANGPMVDGIAIELGWVSACDNLWLNDMLMCKLMKIPLTKVDHLVYGQRLGLFPDLAACEISCNFQEFIDERFYLKRNIWNRLAKLTWYSGQLNHLVYFSGLSGAIHKIMYSIRKKSKDLKAKGVDWDF